MFEEYKDYTIYEYLLKNTEKYRKNNALLYKGKFFTYDQLLSKVNSFAKQFTRLGFQENDIITMCLPNIPEAVYLFYSINQIGAISNIIHPLMNYDQLREILLRLNSKILFILDTRYEEFAPLEKEGITVVPVCPAHELGKFAQKVYIQTNIKKLSYLNSNNYFKIEHFYTQEDYTQYNKDAYKDSIYLHSGGTMGESKTVALSSSSINSVCLNAYDILGIDPNYKKKMYMLSALPMFHGFGLGIGIHISFMFGGCDCLMPKFSAKETLKLIKKKRMSVLIGVPRLFEALLHVKGFKGRKLRCLKTAFIGGDFVSDSLIDRFDSVMRKAKSECRLLQGYGLTETVAVCAVNRIKDNKAYTVGKPLLNAKIDCFDENNNKLGINQEGEICISGDTLMNGYVFQKTKIDDPFFTYEGRKYLHTGDFGKIDEDGFVIFEQRIKRIIKVNGINIFPSEVENCVSSLPYVFQCAAIGVKDDRFGEIIKLFVVLNKNHTLKNYTQEDYNKDIIENIINKCTIYAKPKEIVYLDKLPTTLIGKVDTKNLK